MKTIVKGDYFKKTTGILSQSNVTTFKSSYYR